jgi:hypothetical protein
MICEISRGGIALSFDGLTGHALKTAQDVVERVLPERGPKATSVLLLQRVVDGPDHARNKEIAAKTEHQSQPTSPAVQPEGVGEPTQPADRG